jgi:ABC-type phosphate transport system substrate-binding protein
MHVRLSRLLRWGAVATVLAVVGLLAPPAQAASFVPLSGDGSSWAEPAIHQWSVDVESRGIRIDFGGQGSQAGRTKYMQGQADFAASDIAFITDSNPDPFGGGGESQQYAYSYIPIVAGGTSFLYNLTVGGKKITNLRLSGDTITKIFTGQITNWNDARITKDYGMRLPSKRINVITRSDGSGATYMFTRWMAKQYGSQWTSFCKARGGGGACGPTEFYPGFSGSIQRQGSDQVANYIASPSYGDGSIGYDEYAYALNSKIPVVKVLNQAGYYTLPTASNVAIALQKAVIDNNSKSVTYLMQNLDHVYTNPDRRTYPLSSYSYLIVPRTSRVANGITVGPPGRFMDGSNPKTSAKGATLSTWLNYVLCGAQQKAGALGYSPLPKNLVQGGFLQEGYIPSHVTVPESKQLNGCNNPTYHNGHNYLVEQAPFPSKCDKVGTPLTCAGGGGGSSGGGSNGSGGGGSSGGGSNGSGGGGSNGSGGGGSGSGNGSSGGPAASRSTAGGAVDPDTGKQLGGSDNSVANDNVSALPVSLTGHGGGSPLFAVLTALEILGAILVPTLLGTWLRKRRPRA